MPRFDPDRIGRLVSEMRKANGRLTNLRALDKQRELLSNSLLAASGASLSGLPVRFPPTSTLTFDWVALVLPSGPLIL